MIEVELPDGSVAEFPDGTSTEVMQGALRKQFGGAPAQTDIYSRNQAYAKPAPANGYQTTLTPDEEAGFQKWVKTNNVPFDPSPTSDYDMRGFYRGLMNGDPNAKTGQNANDGKLHFSDFWKTPYHKSFSAESQYADPTKAPSWNEKDQLVLPNGQIVFDERAQNPSKEKPQDTSFIKDAIRGLGLGARSTIEGLSSLPLAAADLAAYPVNAVSRAVSGKTLIPSYQGTLSSALTSAGLPTPQPGAEQLIDATTRGVASVPAGLGVGGLLAKSANPIVAGTGNILQSAPGVQAVAAGSAGASSDLARQAGIGPDQPITIGGIPVFGKGDAQTVAGLIGGLLGGGVASTLRSSPAETLGSTLPPGSRTGPAPDPLSAQGRTVEYTNAVKTLENADIPLTSGQRSGTNWVKSTERTLSEVPFSGKPLQGLFEQQQQAYQKRLLEMAGNQRGDNMVTRQALENTAEDLGKEYTKALAGKTVNIADDAFMNDLAAIEAKHTQFIDDPSKLKVRQIVDSFVDQAAKDNGQVSGEWYQAQRSLFAKRAMKTTDVADLYGDLKGLLDDAFTRAAGNVKGNVDSRYARFKQLQSIFERTGGPAASEGFISPVGVAREAAGAPGGRAWQDFTRAAAAVMPDRLNNSGTAQRNFVLGLLGGSVPASVMNPTAGLLAAGGMGAGRLTASMLARQAPALANPSALPQSFIGLLDQQANQ